MRPSTLQPQIKLHQGEDAPDTIIIYSISSDPTPLNYAHPTAMTGNQVQEMIGQAMDSFAKQQRQVNEQFKIPMQNAITMQFSNLGVVLLQNLQQA